jgi:hypothetical protein
MMEWMIGTDLMVKTSGTRPIMVMVGVDCAARLDDPSVTRHSHQVSG